MNPVPPTPQGGSHEPPRPPQIDFLPELTRSLEDFGGRIDQIAADIHAKPELRFKEYFAAQRLTEEFRASDFVVESGIADMPTAFVATHVSGEGGPTIGIFCEYDALDGLGHACGHNLIAAAGFGAALLVQQWMRTHPEYPATLRILGSPGEEGGGGKVFLIDAGYVDDLSVAMMVHPGESTQPWFNSIARAVVSVEFNGKAAHAAASPFEGVNALDAATLALTAIGLLRQQVRQESRIHGIVTKGGEASNTIPDHTELLMQVRSPSIEYLTDRCYLQSPTASTAQPSRPARPRRFHRLFRSTTPC